MDHCLAADVCTQIMDDIGSAANSFPEMLTNDRKIFDSLKRAGLKLSSEKCQFGMSQTFYLGNVITTNGIQP